MNSRGEYEAEHNTMEIQTHIHAFISVASMPIYTDLVQALKGERLSSVFSSDGILISASAAPHCREGVGP